MAKYYCLKLPFKVYFNQIKYFVELTDTRISFWGVSKEGGGKYA